MQCSFSPLHRIFYRIFFTAADCAAILSHCGKGFFKIVYDVVRVFKPDREAHHSRLYASDVGFVKSELDRDDGIIAYEVEFSKGFVEYEYKIDAVTGAMIEFESEYDD